MLSRVSSVPGLSERGALRPALGAAARQRDWAPLLPQVDAFQHFDDLLRPDALDFDHLGVDGVRLVGLHEAPHAGADALAHGGALAACEQRGEAADVVPVLLHALLVDGLAARPPTGVQAVSRKPAWWRGECGHVYQMAVRDRVRAKPGYCPYCSGRKRPERPIRLD